MALEKQLKALTDPELKEAVEGSIQKLKKELAEKQ